MLKIDISQIIPATGFAALTDVAIQDLIERTADAAKAKWIALSQERLRSTEQEYTRSIIGPLVEPFRATVELPESAVLPNLVEHGMAPFDMRDTLLKGRQSRAIFFGIGGAGTTGRNIKPATAMYQPFTDPDEAKRIGISAMRKIGQLKPAHRHPSGKVDWSKAGRLPEGAATNLRGRSHAFGPGGEFMPRGGREHTTDLFAGAMRIKSDIPPGQKKAPMERGTFRTISRNSPDGWIHPGIPAHHLADEASEYALKTASELMLALFEKG